MEENNISNAQLQVVQRLNQRIYGREDSAPDEETKNIYKCFATKKKGYFEKNNCDGYFLLSAQRLYFMTDYPNAPNHRGSQYSFFSTHIKDITTVSASYDKSKNYRAMFLGILLAILSAGLLIWFLFTAMLDWYLELLIVAVLGLIAYSLIFNKQRNYKITIGTHNGGITIMGGTAGTARKTKSTNGANVIIYNAMPIEKNFYEFIEVINSRISTLQERGDYAD